MKGRAVCVVLLCAGVLAGCSTGWKPTPGDSANGSSYAATPDGYYRVKKGDSLHAIAFKFGKDWKDLALWNGIRPPYTIYPDQQLRLSAGTGQQASTAVPKSSSTGNSSSPSGTVVKAAPPKGANSVTYDAPPEGANSVTYDAPPSTASAPPPAPAKPVSADPGKWLWPAEGRIISTFKPNDPARKGIDIGGNEGQAVIASAAGEVVYSGSGLLGYGELVIIKHSESILSAYAHNRKRLVKEGQRVSAGERIAEMGSNDRSQAMLHFEIRLNGNPQDPLKYLPGR